MSVQELDRLDIARRFAEALDRDDFSAARNLLAADSTYDSPTGLLTGVEAIMQSYRSNSGKVRSMFDRVEYASEVQPAEAEVCRILFSDHLYHKGRVHTFRCAQELKVNDRGLIIHIRHQELPGERSALNTFLHEQGISSGI